MCHLFAACVSLPFATQQNVRRALPVYASPGTGLNVIPPTSKVTHYFTTSYQLQQTVTLFSLLLTDTSPVPMLRDIESKGVVCAV